MEFVLLISFVIILEIDLFQQSLMLRVVVALDE